MSDTYHLKCRDCSEQLWIGQGNGAGREGGYLYRGEKYDKPLDDFILKHMRHSLVIWNEYSYDDDSPDGSPPDPWREKARVLAEALDDVLYQEFSGPGPISIEAKIIMHELGIENPGRNP